MVVPSTTSRDQVLELIKQKESIEHKISEQGKILEAVSTHHRFKVQIPQRHSLFPLSRTASE